ncbi:hypothetical protein C8R43DRAFT_1066488 [Mycena crocata]|nr:hypothetical protein C8R43DRAFT_1066488 [Mycena crocata]
MNEQHHADIVRKLNTTPSKYIESARHQSAAGLADLLDLSMTWAYVPKTMDLGIIDMFLSHLRAEKAPMLTRVPRKWQRDGDFANLSLLALGGMEKFLDDPKFETQSRAVVDAWPGIFKWCSYIYDARVAAGSVQDRRMFSDSIVKVLYTFSCFNLFIKAMVSTAGCLELLTKLWALEDVPAEAESIILGPIQTATLGTIVKWATLLGRENIQDRVVKAAGGDVNVVVKLLLGRVKKATKAFNPDLGALGLSWHIALVTELCHPPHPLCRAFFENDVIGVVTRAFVAISRTVTPTPNSLLMMTSCFDFFTRCLEGDDYPELVHAVKAGFLGAFLDCSRMFSGLPADTVDEALLIMGQTLPKYLVYRSFIEAVNSALEHLRTPHYQQLIAQPSVRGVWLPFLALLAKRMPTLKHIQNLKAEGTPVTCDYIRCEAIDAKNTFKTCAACRSAYYCSPQCQKLAWKAGHKSLCKQTQNEDASHREKGRPKRDMPFCHTLATGEANIEFARFHALADKHFPNTPRRALFPCIDYSKVPTEYSVKEFKAGLFNHPGVFHSAADAKEGEARFQAMMDKVSLDPDATIVQSVIASGATIEILVTPMPYKCYWEDTNTYTGSSGDEVSTSDDESEGTDDERGDPSLNDID